MGFHRNVDVQIDSIVSLVLYSRTGRQPPCPRSDIFVMPSVGLDMYTQLRSWHPKHPNRLSPLYPFRSQNRLLGPRGLGVFPELGDLVDRMDLGLEINLLLPLVDVVLLQELGALDLLVGQQLQVSLWVAQKSASLWPELVASAILDSPRRWPQFSRWFTPSRL